MSELPPPVFEPFVKVLEELPTWGKTWDAILSYIFNTKTKVIFGEKNSTSE